MNEILGALKSFTTIRVRYQVLALNESNQKLNLKIRRIPNRFVVNSNHHEHGIPVYVYIYILNEFYMNH